MRHDNVEDRCRKVRVSLQNLISLASVAGGDDAEALFSRMVATNLRIAGSSSATRMRLPSLLASVLAMSSTSFLLQTSTARQLSPACVRQLRGEFYRRHHTRVFCETFACDVERGSVIDRSSYEWQSQGHVHRFARMKDISRESSPGHDNRQSLRQTRRAKRAENRVRGERSLNINIIQPATGFDSRRDFRGFFHSKQVHLQHRADSEQQLQVSGVRYPIAEAHGLPD